MDKQETQTTQTSIISLLLEFLIETLPTGILVILQAVILFMVRVNEKVQAEREAVAMLESAQETTFFSTLVPNVLLALCAAFTLNFILVLIYSREKKNPDIEMMSGNCAHFEIKKKEIM